MKETIKDFSLYDTTRVMYGAEKFDLLSEEEKQRQFKLNYLAELLVGCYFDMKELRKDRDQN